MEFRPVDTLTSASTQVALTAATAASLLPANQQRNGCNISHGSASTGALLLSLSSSVTPTASVFHITLAPGQSWNGLIGASIWRGPVIGFNTAGATVGVVEV